MRTVKAVIQYDGTHFAGWQRQPKKPSIQSAVEGVLAKIEGAPVKVVASSRTDGGVHAEGQSIHFRLKSGLADKVLKRAMNFHLPGSIAVKSLQTAPDDFHARYHAKKKLYRYTVYTGSVKPVFLAPYVLWCRDRLDIRKMRKAAEFLTGEHDFASFAGADDRKGSKVRKVLSIRFKKEKDRLAIDVLGNGFLRNMVRIIVGTLLLAGCGKIVPEAVKTILESKDRRLAGKTVSPAGLRLIKVYY